jgi:DNA ligase (NAD+)
MRPRDINTCTIIGVANVIGWQVFDDAAMESPNTVAAYLFDWENNVRAKLDYEIDGMVFAANSLADQDQAGWSGKCPKGKMAFKFKPEQKPAEIVRVDWFVGRLGKVTPVAVITPTRLAGTTVTNVTLHNLANVRALDIHIGDKVLVEKAGDIIPQIVRVLEPTQSTHPEDVVPRECPVCKGQVKPDDRNVSLWCQNEDCPAKLVRKVLHYLDCLKVLGIGEGIVQKLCLSGMVKTLSDLYYLDQSALVGLLGGQRSAEKVYLAIMEKNEIDLAVFLDALGIDGLGTSTSKQMAKQFKTLDACLSQNQTSLMGMEGIGSTTATKILTGLDKMSPVIAALRAAIDIKEVETKMGPLVGMSFCLTGEMSRVRSVIEKEIEAAGGEIKSCGRGLGFLVQADPASTSSKSDKAKKLGIKIISEDELYKMMGK